MRQLLAILILLIAIGGWAQPTPTGTTALARKGARWSDGISGEICRLVWEQQLPTGIYNILGHSVRVWRGHAIVLFKDCSPQTCGRPLRLAPEHAVVKVEGDPFLRVDYCGNRISEVWWQNHQTRQITTVHTITTTTTSTPLPVVRVEEGRDDVLPVVIGGAIVGAGLGAIGTSILSGGLRPSRRPRLRPQPWGDHSGRGP